MFLSRDLCWTEDVGRAACFESFPEAAKLHEALKLGSRVEFYYLFDDNGQSAWDFTFPLSAAESSQRSRVVTG